MPGRQNGSFKVTAGGNDLTAAGEAKERTEREDRKHSKGSHLLEEWVERAKEEVVSPAEE